MEYSAGGGRNVHELLTLLISQQERWFAVTHIGIVHLDGVDHVRLNDQQVFPAVVVIIEKRTPQPECKREIAFRPVTVVE